MVRERFRSIPERLRRRLVAGILLAGQLVAAFGLPLPMPGNHCGKSFLCRTRPCGCLTDDECVRCCCSTREDKRAWTDARLSKSYPQIPQVNAAPSGKARCCSETSDSVSGTRSCCATSSQEGPCPLCGSASRSEKSACSDCEKRSGEANVSVSPVRRPVSGLVMLWVAGMTARQCRGLGPWGMMATLPPAVPGTTFVTWEPDRRAGTLAALPARSPLPPTDRPPVPPPRVL
jgi:hypothetical protein